MSAACGQQIAEGGEFGPRGRPARTIRVRQDPEIAEWHAADGKTSVAAVHDEGIRCGIVDGRTALSGWGRRSGGRKFRPHRSRKVIRITQHPDIIEIVGHAVRAAEYD